MKALSLAIQATFHSVSGLLGNRVSSSSFFFLLLTSQLRSSAIVTATMRALLRYFGLEASQFGSDTEWAEWIMAAEAEQLKIAAGLQDRVAQWFNRPMAMNFSGPRPVLNPLGGITLDLLVNTPMYVIWSNKAEESGVVHTSLRSLWEKDPQVKECMQMVARLPALFDHHSWTRTQLCDAIDQNFNLRHQMLGVGVGVFNLEMVTMARSLGLAAKQAGSGGAIFCVPRTDLSAGQEEEFRETLKVKGYVLCKVAPVVGTN